MCVCGMGRGAGRGGCDPPLQRDASLAPTPGSATVTDLGDHPLGFMHVCVWDGEGEVGRGGAEGS